MDLVPVELLQAHFDFIVNGVSRCFREFLFGAVIWIKTTTTDHHLLALMTLFKNHTILQSKFLAGNPLRTLLVPS